MFAVEKPSYALLGRRESYSIGNRQAKKDALFQEALRTIHDTIDNPNFVSIPDLVNKIYYGNASQLNPIRESLKSNSLFPCTTCLSASGNKILAYLAVLYDKNCLTENGDIDLAYTKDIIRSFFADETINKIRFDDSAIRNLKSEFPDKDNIHIVHHKIQAHINKQERTIRLFQAFEKQNLTAVQEAFWRGADISSQDANASTPLMWAIHNGWLEMAQDLFSASSIGTINAVNKWGETALLYACLRLTDIPFLTQLLARSSPEAINTIDLGGHTALILACETLTDIPFLTQLLARFSPDAINTVNGEGQTALMIACANLTDIPFLTQLLERSSPEAINAVDVGGHTALILACETLTDIPFLTQLLTLSSPEVINTVNKNGITALIALVWADTNPALVQQLLPLILPHLTWTNFRSSYKDPNMATGKTAWQIADERGAGPWADIVNRIGEAMLMECAQRHIPWGRTHHKAAIQKKLLTHGEQTPANVCENILLEQKKIPEDILGIIRNYNENAFNDPQEALDAINDFLKRHLQQKEQYKEDGSQLFESVNDVMSALHDYASELNLSLAEYASTLHVP